MIDFSPAQRYRYALGVALGLGWLVAGVEILALGVTTAAPTTIAGLMLVALVDAVGLGSVAVIAAAIVGLLQRRWAQVPSASAIARQACAAGPALAAVWLLPAAADQARHGSRAAAVILALLPLAFGAMVFLQARHQLRKVEVGNEYPVSFPVGAGLVALALALVGASVASWRPEGAGDRPNVLLVTIDTLRRDHVDAYGVPGAPPTPSFDRVAQEGVLFDDAVTPLPETAPSHSTMLTGAHPLRHGVLSNGDVLSSATPSVAETLAGQGYATAGFVSSYAMDARTGLSRGFQTWDDALAPGPVGWTKLALVRPLVALWMSRGDPARTPWLLERAAPSTNARFFAWLDRHDGQPFFALVHYFEPHAPYEPHAPDTSTVDHRRILEDPGHVYTDAEREELRRLYSGEVVAADEALGQLLAELDARGLTGRTLVIVTGDHGELLGEHGVDFAHRELWDEVVRVPLAVRAPGRDVAEPVVAAQVSLVDVAPTILDWCGAPPLDRAEGVSLLDYATGKRTQSMWTSLVGHMGKSYAEGPLIGLRTSEIKYVHDLQDGTEHVWAWPSDPGESTELTPDPKDLETFRQLLAPETTALAKRLPVEGPVPVQAEAMLRQLGYVQ